MRTRWRDGPLIAKTANESRHSDHVSDGGTAMMLPRRGRPASPEHHHCHHGLGPGPDRGHGAGADESDGAGLPSPFGDAAVASRDARSVVVRDFDLSYHLQWIAAPEPKTLDTVFEFARQSSMSGLDTDRPLWGFTVVEGLDGGRAAVVVKLHHVLTDGVGGIAMLPSIVNSLAGPAISGRCRRYPMTMTTSRAATPSRSTRWARAASVRPACYVTAGGLVVRNAPHVTPSLPPPLWAATSRLSGGS